jgi:hypothetical protein
MPQVTRGIILGSPGPNGSGPVADLYGNGAPASSTDPNVSLAVTGSTYRDIVGGVLYFKKADGLWHSVTTS